MTKGDEPPPGARLCPKCEQRWYSAALLGDTGAVCPDCGTQLEHADDEHADG